ncbi:hypothetical protein TSUD_370540 [Trifolium subterraneum]|uniref:Reverse transcriptase domain-containing protein n=1 Tax=Trifolium subterraneum TaxID=3900 RepID=A0A2Z6N675_TRISU|nr:hypothetical protein TSUD_370540 [Trifolium subterraneum]
MEPFNIPWKFLDLSSESPKNTIEPNKSIIEPIINEPSKPQKTFAQAVNNLCDIPLSQLPQPVEKGERLAIEIPEVFYQVGLEACKHNLHGRMLWPKGSTPLSVAALKEKLSLLWKDLSKWGVISLGKGFYEFTFSSLEDVRRVRTSPSWNLNPGFLKLFAWSRDFNPKLQNNTSVQVWVRIYGLAQEYWQKNILFTIASSVGTPICMDTATAKPLHERTFDFCTNCRTIGHHVDICKRWNKEEEGKTNQEHNPKKKPQPNTKPVFVQVSDGRKQQDNHNEAPFVENEVINVEDTGEKESSLVLEVVHVTNGEVQQDPINPPTNQIESGVNEDMALSPKASLHQQDLQLEKELNQHLDLTTTESDSASSSFVNNTIDQPLLEDGVSPLVKLNIPERVTKDMNFLEQSWVNMVEAEQDADQETQNIVEDSARSLNIQGDGFQVVLSKTQKQKQKRKHQSSRDSYATRAKKTIQPLLFSAIYASTNYINRRRLWNSLNLLHAQHALPWCFIGDFNVILGAHEHRGRFSPARTPMLEFQNWTDTFNLIHLPTRGAEFTWNNGRGGSRHTEKRLDRAICNQAWLDLCSVSSVSTLIKQKSDHFPLLLEAQVTSVQIVSQFKFMKMWSLHPDCQRIVKESWQNNVLGCPMFILTKKLKLLKEKLKSWNKECFGNVHNLVTDSEQKLHEIQSLIQQNGHSDILLQEERNASKLYEETLNMQEDSLLAEEVIPNLVTNEINDLMTVLPSLDELYWDIVKTDLFNAVLEFFSSSWIFPGFNSNIIALLPKTPEASSIDQNRPIAMANFKFKVISKILADRLASIMPSLVSEEQKGFIHDRNIKDCLCIASEAANLLHNKSFGGNLAPKIDITKAFDTLDWSFLLKVLKSFGFNEIFCNWIHVILQSAFLSVSINGKSYGYFNCTRGVRQGDPLSPLIFCLAEDVLSRHITKLVSDGKLNLIKGTRHVHVPSHSFYADDLMIFCKGNLAGLRELKTLFSRYAADSGQLVNTAKSTIFSGSITPRRLALIVQLLNFSIGVLPFNYLGVPIFKGKPRVCHLQPIADKIKLKLSSWKASLLSIAGRVQLVRSVVHSMLMPLAQGGVNLRSFSKLNKATNLKLCWTMLSSHQSWATLLKARVFRSKNVIHHHIFSSLWSSIKEEFGVIKDNSAWILGDGEDINFWNDNWCGTPLAEFFNIPLHVRPLLTSTVSDYLVDGQWSIPEQLSHAFPQLCNTLNQVTIPLEHAPDQLLWKHTDSGDLSLKDAYGFKMQNFDELHWATIIWNTDIPPSKSFLVWRLMHNKVPTDENLMVRGCNMPSMCSICKCHVESTFHIFFECSFATRTWSWFAGILNVVLQLNSMDDIWKLCDDHWSPQCKVTITAAVIFLINTLWFVRNQARFHDNLISWDSAIALIIASTSITGNHTSNSSSNSLRDFSVWKCFKVEIHPSKPVVLKEICWQPPVLNWLKCNIDGASIGNPGLASCAGVFRDASADFVLGFAEPLGVATSFFAELCGAMRAIEIAYHNHWQNIWVETDSTLVITAFQKQNHIVPWSLRNRWKNTLYMARTLNLILTHIFREGNQVADILANHGLNLDSLMYWHTPPLFIIDSLAMNKSGFRSFRVCHG